MEVFFDNVVEQRWEGVPGRMLAIVRTIKHCRYTETRRVNLPRPESDHESKPREEEHATMNADHIEKRHRASLVVDGVELWCFPEQGRVEANHLYWPIPRKVGRMGV